MAALPIIDNLKPASTAWYTQFAQRYNDAVVLLERLCRDVLAFDRLPAAADLRSATRAAAKAGGAHLFDGYDCEIIRDLSGFSPSAAASYR